VAAQFRDVLETMRKKLSDVQAILIVGPDGVVDHVLADSSLKIETIASEYAMLLRIAGRASQDAGAGNLVEQTVISEKSVMIARLVSPQHFVILITKAQEPDRPGSFRTQERRFGDSKTHFLRGIPRKKREFTGLTAI